MKNNDYHSSHDYSCAPACPRHENQHCGLSGPCEPEMEQDNAR